MAGTEKTTQVIQVVKAETESINQLATAKIDAANILANAMKDNTESFESLSHNYNIINTFIQEKLIPLVDQSIGYDYLGTGTVIAATAVAIAYFRQVNTMQDQVKELEKQTIEIEQHNISEQYWNAIKMLDPTAGIIGNNAALKTIKFITINNPAKYYSDTISTLIIIGRVFSDRLNTDFFELGRNEYMVMSDDQFMEHFEKFVKDPTLKQDGIKTSEIEISHLVFEVLNCIFEIHHHDNCTAFRPQTDQTQDLIKITGFKIPYPELKIGTSYRKHSISKRNLDRFIFEDCNLYGITFNYCDLANCEFLFSKYVNIRESRLNFKTVLDNITGTAHAINAHIFFEECYAWDNEIAPIENAFKMRNYTPEEFPDITEMNMEDFGQVWEKLDFPKIPSSWHLYKKETRTPDGNMRDIQDL
ncbi:MAG: hypothetical protein OCD03_02770 [Hyphomicrobiales bacterium]